PPDGAAGRLRLAARDRDLLPHERVRQGGLTHVGAPHEGDEPRPETVRQAGHSSAPTVASALSALSPSPSRVLSRLTMIVTIRPRRRSTLSAVRSSPEWDAVEPSSGRRPRIFARRPPAE